MTTTTKPKLSDLIEAGAALPNVKQGHRWFVRVRPTEDGQEEILACAIGMAGLAVSA